VNNITVQKNSLGLLQTDKDIGRIWENYLNLKADFHQKSAEIFQGYGSSCPAVGCGRCELPIVFSMNLSGITGIVLMETDAKTRLPGMESDEINFHP
jgi:hypothetical protein